MEISESVKILITFQEFKFNVECYLNTYEKDQTVHIVLVNSFLDSLDNYTIDKYSIEMCFAGKTIFLEKENA